MQAPFSKIWILSQVYYRPTVNCKYFSRKSGVVDNGVTEIVDPWISMPPVSLCILFWVRLSPQGFNVLRRDFIFLLNNQFIPKKFRCAIM